MSEENIIICLKDDPDLVFARYEVYAITGVDPDTWMPIVGLATSDNQKEVGVVIAASAKGVLNVSLQFSGVTILRVSVPSGDADPGVSLGVKTGSNISVLAGSGIGLVLKQLDTSGVERRVLANLSGGGDSIIRWRKWDDS